VDVYRRVDDEIDNSPFNKNSVLGTPGFLKAIT
jgi:uncharacterized circularly permuted ATP-grasp superfamily protein